MQEQGWSRRRVVSAIRAARLEDRSFTDGSILGSMCTAPHEVAIDAHTRFIETNLGDPGHFPGTARLEREVLDDLLGLMHAPGGAAGRLLSGGTEANIMACYLAREKTGRREVVLPDSAHFSFEKAAKLMGLALRRVPTRPDGRADVPAMEAAIGPQTALVVGIAGTTELGLVDPIDELAAMCARKGVLLHVDAAYGGYMLPFMEDAGRRAFPFDFALPGVWSLGLDPHKGGMSTIPAGVLLLRDGADWELTAVESPYLSTKTQSTLLGTRPGAAAAAAWAVHRHLGRDGFASITETCLDNAAYLCVRLHELGLDVVQAPDLGVVTFRHADPEGFAARLRERDWSVNIVRRMSAIRVVVQPHVSRDVLDRFLVAAAECVA